MNTNAGCTDGGKNLRGAEKAPNGRRRQRRTGHRSRRTMHKTGKVTWADQDPSANIAYDGGAAQLFGEDSWKWMLLQPSLADNQE